MKRREEGEEESWETETARRGREVEREITTLT